MDNNKISNGNLRDAYLCVTDLYFLIPITRDFGSLLTLLFSWLVIWGICYENGPKQSWEFETPAKSGIYK